MGTIIIIAVLIVIVAAAVIRQRNISRVKVDAVAAVRTVYHHRIRSLLSQR